MKIPGCSIEYPLSVHKESSKSSMQVPWKLHGVPFRIHRIGFSMEFPLILHGTLWSLGSSIEYPLSAHKKSSKSSIEVHGNSMEFFGGSMETPWSSMESP